MVKLRKIRKKNVISRIMAKSSVNIGTQCEQIVTDIRRGVFSPVYLLMGDEPFYPELICDAIIEHCIPLEDKDFNETIRFGADVNAAQVTATARQYPMMADRQLVVVKEAQMMPDLEQMATYCSAPLESTVLVLLMRKASADKRKALYKAVQKNGIVIDSPAIRDYEVAGWISSYYRGRGLDISPQAAALLGEYAGTDLSKIAIETDKLLKNLPEGAKEVKAEDIERNVGISRQFSIFELTKALSLKDAPKALRIAAAISSDARFYMPPAISAIFTNFSRILRYSALLSRSPRPSPEEKAKVLAGVNPYFYKEYDAAVRNYPLPKAMEAISLLCRYDYLAKGGDGGTAAADELLVELCAKIVSL